MSRRSSSAARARVLRFPPRATAGLERADPPSPSGWLRRAVCDDATTQAPDALIDAILQAWRASA